MHDLGWVGIEREEWIERKQKRRVCRLRDVGCDRGGRLFLGGWTGGLGLGWICMP